MKLYILNDVLSDYTSGMAVIAAENMDQCRELFMKEFGEWSAKDFDEHARFTIIESVSVEEAHVIEYVYGGG
jgi:hypothetical protein